MTDLAEMNKTQAETITRYQRENLALSRERDWYRERCEAKQRYIERLQDHVAELECPKRRAERFFTTEGQGE